MNRYIGAVALTICLALTGCSNSDSTPTAGTTGMPDFFESATDLERAIYDGCITYRFASLYFKLMLDEQASDNEIFYMAKEMDEAKDDFQEAIDIDEAEGGYQYKRYINFRNLAAEIADTPNYGLDWTPSAEVKHQGLLKWCSDWSVQIVKNYDGINSWPSKLGILTDGQRKP